MSIAPQIVDYLLPSTYKYHVAAIVECMEKGRVVEKVIDFPPSGILDNFKVFSIESWMQDMKVYNFKTYYNTSEAAKYADAVKVKYNPENPAAVFILDKNYVSFVDLNNPLINRDLSYLGKLTEAIEYPELWDFANELRKAVYEKKNINVILQMFEDNLKTDELKRIFAYHFGKESGTLYNIFMTTYSADYEKIKPFFGF